MERTNHLIVEIDLADHVDAAALVRELELKDVDAVKATGRATVLIAPLVALEGWLEERGIPSVPVRLRGATHVVRRRRAA